MASDCLSLPVLAFQLSHSGHELGLGPAHHVGTLSEREKAKMHPGRGGSNTRRRSSSRRGRVGRGGVEVVVVVVAAS